LIKQLQLFKKERIRREKDLNDLLSETFEKEKKILHANTAENQDVFKYAAAALRNSPGVESYKRYGVSHSIRIVVFDVESLKPVINEILSS
jgi:hypothetical protein